MNKLWKRWIAAGLMLSCLGGASLSAQDVPVKAYIVHADHYQLPYKGNEKAFHHQINPGYGSSLAFKDIKSDGTIEFYGLTDRGPNVTSRNISKTAKKCPGNSSRRRILRPVSASSP